MSQLEDNVKKIVNDFVAKDMLFTALDVSLAVKKDSPFARHSEIRDIVRGMFSDMQTSSYGRTVIQVTLEDGTKQDALLYHPLSDSWDLDMKYDNSKRVSKASFAKSSQVPLIFLAASAGGPPASLPVPMPKASNVIKFPITGVTGPTGPHGGPHGMFDSAQPKKIVDVGTVPAVKVKDKTTPIVTTSDPKELWSNLFGTTKLFPTI